MPDRDMPNPDVQLRDHLQELYRNALSQVRAPGVALVRRSARRRMATHATAVVVLVAALVVAAVAQPWVPLTTGTPAATATSTPTPAPTTPRPSTSASPTTPPASQSASAASSTTYSAGPDAVPSGGGNASPGQDCERHGVIDVTELMNFGYATVSVRLPAEHPDWALLLCPGEKVRVFWASYTVDPAGVQHLYRYEERVLDEATPTWRMYVDMKWDGLCGPTWYISSGGDAIPTTIPLGTTVFPRKVHWDDQNAKPGCDPTPIPS